MTTHASSSPARRSDGDDASVEILPPLADGDDWTCTPDDITLPPELEFDTVERIGGRNAVTPMKQRVFIRVLAETGRVCLAAKAAGNVPGSFYFLRNHARGKSFAEAWDRARDFGTGRVLDVLLDHAINGTPEYIYKGGELVAERRRFNHPMMMWLVAHNYPEKFGVAGGLMHGAQSGPGGGAAAAARMKRIKAEWRAEWEAERRSAARSVDVEAVKAEIVRKARLLDRPRMVEVARNPEKRAAYELLNGEVDWSAFE